jgi:hypothetical protein
MVINKDKMFDRRLIERNIKKGRLDKKEYEKHMKNLEDSSKMKEELNILEDEEETEEMPKTEDFSE